MGEEYGVGKEEEVSKVWTLHESECVPCDGQSRGSVSEQDTEGDTDTSSGPIVPVTAVPVSSDVQPHTATGSKDMSHNGPDTRAEPLDEENRDGTERLEIGSEGFQPGHASSQPESDNSQVQPACDEDSDAEIARRAREEDRVDVIFPGSVTQDGCCRFVCELLKCILYQRQQLPMTYDQMVFFQKQQLATTQLEEAVARKSIKPSGDSTWQRCHRTLRDMDEVLGHLEMLFSLSYVPRILFILGNSTNLPTELYEINMEALVQGGSDRSLRTSQCLRRLFRTLFVADLLSDVKPVRLMGTTVMALAHRDCGVEWFKPKVDFRVPTRVKRQVISLASDASGSDQRKVDTTDWDDYIWFQTPVAIKGFCK